jgi:sporulation protein YlmC with PRC-barrel domain
MKLENTTTQRVEELMNKRIITAGGKTIGHVFDIQLSRDGKHRVTALMYGQKSLLYRLHVYEPVARAFRLKQKPKTIPWEAVEYFDRTAVRLKPGYEAGL